MSLLLQEIEKHIRLTDELREVIESSFQFEKIQKGDALLKEGHYCRHLYFLEKGTIRNYYHNDKQEISTWFYKEGSFFTSWYGFYTQYPGYEAIEALEDSEVYSIHYDEYQKLMNKHLLFERFARLMAQEHIALVDVFTRGYMFLSAKEKYDLILDYFPDIEQRVKLGQLASFLGISQETLSRVRGTK